jgi:hypothetical protein
MAGLVQIYGLPPHEGGVAALETAGGGPGARDYKKVGFPLISKRF